MNVRNDDTPPAADYEDLVRRQRRMISVIEGTAGKTGQEYFDALAERVARDFGVDVVAVTECVSGGDPQLRTVAFWKMDGPSDGIEYDPRGTPCETVVGGESHVVRDGLREKYPQDELLHELALESYAGVPMFDAKGVVIGHLALMHGAPIEIDDDVMAILGMFAARAGAELERVRIEEALRDKEEFLTAILHNAHEGIVACDADGVLTMFNRATRELHAQNENAIPSSEWASRYSLYCADGKTLMREDQVPLYRALHDEIVVDVELIVAMPGERPRTVTTNGQPLYARDGRKLGAVVVMHEITERKKAEDDLRRLNEELEQRVLTRTEELRVAKDAAETANRAKSSFLANMSHELRTPLNAVLGFTRLILGDDNLTGRQRENLNVINRSGEHLLGLINDVLEMSKIEAGRATLNEKDFDLVSLMNELEDMFRLKADDKGLTIRFEQSSGSSRWFHGDEGKLRQVLINLIGNAMKFTEKGSVCVKTVTTTGADGDIQLSLRVEDTGSGISATHLEELFDPFVQIANRVSTESGTGLGLPISRRFVELMGGTLSATSQEGNGSTFIVDVTLKKGVSRGVSETNDRRRPVALEAGQTKYRLLIVEDNEANAELLRQLLEKVGFETRCAPDGKEGIAIWEEWEPQLIWMDMRMPVMDGYEATKQIKATVHGQATAIIALTASAFEEERVAVLGAGCDDFLKKPFREAEIFEVLTRHLGVRFRYEDVTPHDDGTSKEIEFTAATLSRIDSDVRRDIEAAVRQLDVDRAMNSVNAISPEHAEIANALRRRIEAYEFDTVLGVLQAADELAGQ